MLDMFLRTLSGNENVCSVGVESINIIMKKTKPPMTYIITMKKTKHQHKKEGFIIYSKSSS